MLGGAPQSTAEKERNIIITRYTIAANIRLQTGVSSLHFPLIRQVMEALPLILYPLAQE